MKTTNSKTFQPLKLKQTHCTKMFWSNDCEKPQLGENPEEEFLIKEEYSKNFQQKKLFLRPSLTKFQI